MRNRTLEKKPTRLCFTTHLALAFNLVPTTLVESRQVFKDALGPNESTNPITWLRRKLHGRIVKYSRVWIRAFKAWVEACDGRKEELKGAFFSVTKYPFRPSKGKTDTGDSPLLQVVVEAWLEALEPNLHINDHKDLWKLASGVWIDCPYSKWQQAALMRWMSAAHDNKEHNRGISLCKPGTIPHDTYVLNKPLGGYRGE